MRRSPFPDMEACPGQSSPPYEKVTEVLGKAKEKVLAQQESEHFVALVPATAAFDTGEAEVSAAAYTRLPIDAKSTTGYGTKLTKVVMVGASASASGLYLADCGGLTDTAAADWLRQKAATQVNSLPLNDGTGSASPLEMQVPFLNLVFEGKLPGNVVPLVLGGQSAEAAQQVGNLLRALVQKGGPYVNERVLFLFVGDLSRDLEKKWAQPRDDETVQKLITSSFGDLSVYFSDLEKVQAAGEHRRPYDWPIVLSCLKLASSLQYTGVRIMVGNSGDWIGAPDRNEMDKVRGYASVLFGHDARPLGQRLSAGPQDPKMPETTTTSTTAPPTVAPPPTIIPQDQLALTPGPR